MGTKKTLLKEFLPPALLQAMLFAEDFESPEALVDAQCAQWLNLESRANRRGVSRERWHRSRSCLGDSL